ncbi:hypothetical protein P7H00_01525 [Enterococcus pseudoavium]|uniref:Uncharacterized protein n=1 Tax=Enterococcus pseudoavium TaxID=44007 RepID=A0AAE4L0K6_9ENTE|nr:hypothetical protein [Enterococcus pseudoavium]MDT2735811.1 hypothetical protein [Enterococcus pseudoavium]MDT2754363.1 hypothetical protein [Enterococcus pseudoavium]MDT2769582.1 hypothetical protein [Enterococcus pseudoavium]
MEMNESVLLEVQEELTAAKKELERLEGLTFISELKEERIKTLRQDIQHAEAFILGQANP